jgi:hypothetical protein
LEAEEGGIPSIIVGGESEVVGHSPGSKKVGGGVVLFLKNISFMEVQKEKKKTSIIMKVDSKEWL